jgi:LIVCS family branched-chain amino acid:cation transporter
MFIYPLTIVLILLNALPEKWTSAPVFRWVVGATIFFSIPDFLGSLGVFGIVESVSRWIPFAEANLGWSLPALLVFLIANFLLNQPKKTN